MAENNGVVFWIDSNVIQCTIGKECESKILEDVAPKAFARRITALANGRYLPLLIDLREVGIFYAFRLFTTFSPPSRLDFSVLSTSFLVKSLALRIMLSLYCIATGNAFWNRVYHNPKVALDHCLERFKMGFTDNQEMVGIWKR